MVTNLTISFQKNPEASQKSVAQTNSGDEDWEPLSIKVEVKE
jgi:hypothetical protein